MVAVLQPSARGELTIRSRDPAPNPALDRIAEPKPRTVDC
jgi:hypothetical protein